MRFENGKVITDYTKRARTDNSLKGIKTLAKKDKEKADQVADEIIKKYIPDTYDERHEGMLCIVYRYRLGRVFKKAFETKIMR